MAKIRKKSETLSSCRFSIRRYSDDMMLHGLSWSFGCRGMSNRQHLYLYRRGDCMAGRTRSVTVWPYAGGGGCSGASDVDFGAVENEKVKKHRFFFADKKLSSTFASSLRQEHIIGLWCNGNTTDSGPVIPSSNLGSPTPRPPLIAEVFCCLVPIRRCRVIHSAIVSCPKLRKIRKRCFSRLFGCAIWILDKSVPLLP